MAEKWPATIRASFWHWSIELQWRPRSQLEICGVTTWEYQCQTFYQWRKGGQLHLSQGGPRTGSIDSAYFQPKSRKKRETHLSNSPWPTCSPWDRGASACSDYRPPHLHAKSVPAHNWWRVGCRWWGPSTGQEEAEMDLWQVAHSQHHSGESDHLASWGDLYPSGQPAVYEELDSMAFVNGYLTVMGRETHHVKSKMLSHLQERMEDGESYGWPAVHAYHATWLQHLEQGWVTWDDEVTKMKFCGALVWHRGRHLQGSLQPSVGQGDSSPNLQSTASREGA